MCAVAYAASVPTQILYFSLNSNAKNDAKALLIAGGYIENEHFVDCEEDLVIYHKNGEKSQIKFRIH
jgi:competence protein ComGC